MKLNRRSWEPYHGNETEIFTVTDEKTGFLVELTNFGGIIIRVKIPDRNGQIDDICFGQYSPEEYEKQGGYLGAVIGRIANRIRDAKFALEGVEYRLFQNNGNHCLHGGEYGFNLKIWTVIKAESNEEFAEIVLEYISYDGEEGFPGTLSTKLTYRIYPSKIEWEFKSKTDKTTIINLTNHAYWNLDGLSSLIKDLKLKVDADNYMPADDSLISTGEISPVEKDFVDFRQFRKISDVLDSVGDVDHNFVLNNYEENNKVPRLCAELYSKTTGRLMKVYTTEPGLQIYTGNFMDTIYSFGKKCQKYSGLCLETQKFPNAIKMPDHAKTVILKPEQSYYHKTIHEFSIK